VETPLLEVVKHGNVHCMKEERLRGVAHDTQNMSMEAKFSVNMVQPEFRIDCLGVGSTVHSL